MLQKVFDDRRDHTSRLESNSPRGVCHVNVLIVVGLCCGRWHMSSVQKAERCTLYVSGRTEAAPKGQLTSN